MADRCRFRRPAASGRTLHFSPSESLGTLYVRSSDASDEATWSRLGEARWSVLIPQGMRVRLTAGPGTTDLGLAACQGLSTHALDELILLGCPVGDPGITHVADLTGLRLLDLFRTGVTDEALPVVAGLRSLEWLSLTGTSTTDAGIAHLSRLRALRRLSLKETGITDRSLQALAPLSELAWLSLSGTRISDHGLPELARLPNLKMLSVLGTGVTADGAAWWWSARPDVRLVAH